MMHISIKPNQISHSKNEFIRSYTVYIKFVIITNNIKFCVIIFHVKILFYRILDNIAVFYNIFSICMRVNLLAAVPIR